MNLNPSFRLFASLIALVLRAPLLFAQVWWPKSEFMTCWPAVTEPMVSGPPPAATVIPLTRVSA